jgi:Tfp pilus assembly protein PilO
MTDSSGGFTKYKNVVINIGLVAVALFASFKIYAIQEVKLNELKAQKEEEVKKNAVLGDISQLEQKIVAYKAYLNRKDLGRTIDVLGDVAKESAVKITAIKPQEEKELYKFVLRFPFDLTVEAPSYHALGTFVGKLESHPDVFLVESVIIKPVFAPAGTADESRYKITASIILSTILYKE